MASPAPAPLQLELRQGEVGDLDHVMRIMTKAFEPCYGEGWTRSQCAGILPMHGVRLVMAEDHGNPAGFSLSRTVADEAELLLIAVDPERQRLGIGAALLKQFIATAHADGAHRLHLEMRDGNPAVELYRTAGFQPAGRRRNYYRGPSGEHYDAVTLMLST